MSGKRMQIKSHKYDRVNMLVILSIYLLTHFIYTDFLIRQIYAMILLLFIALFNTIYRKGTIHFIIENTLIIYLGLIICVFSMLPGARIDDDTISFAFGKLTTGLILLMLYPSIVQIQKAIKIIKLGSFIIALYIIFCGLNKSFYLNTILPHLSSEVQIRGERLLRHGYGVPMGASVVFADYVFALCMFIIVADYFARKWNATCLA